MFYVFVGCMNEQYLKIKKATEKEEEHLIIIHEREKWKQSFRILSSQKSVNLLYSVSMIGLLLGICFV